MVQAWATLAFRKMAISKARRISLKRRPANKRRPCPNDGDALEECRIQELQEENHMKKQMCWKNMEK